MTLEELQEEIENLITMNGKEILGMEVMAVYDYGDHCHTEALTSFSTLEITKPRKSAYSGSNLAMPCDDSQGDQEVIVALV